MTSKTRVFAISQALQLQVCRAYDGNLEGAKHEGLTSSPVAVKALQQARHRFWLKRKAGDQAAGWRPAKRHRVSAKHFLLNIDNGIRLSLGLRGLVDFQVPEKVENSPWADWRNWRHLCLAIDQGSDGLAACNWLRTSKVNFSVLCDWSHGAQNDLKEALRGCNLFQFILLMMIAMNVEHGPYDEDLRFAQVKESWEDVQKHHTHQSCVIFQELAPKMLRGLRRAGCPNQPSGDDVAEELWQAMIDEPILARKGYKTNLNRYWAVIQKGREMLLVWHKKRCQYEICCIETDMVKGSKLEKLLFKDPELLPNGSAASSSTSSAHVCVSEKALRSCCQNALVISTLMLGEDWHETLLQIICSSVQPIEAWHRSQSCANRSAEQSRVWMIEQLDGGFMHSVASVFKVLSSQKELDRIGYTSHDTTLAHYVTHFSNDLGMVEDDMADVQGSLSLHLTTARVRRKLWFVRGWPIRMLGLGGSPALQASTVADFKRDWCAFEHLRDLPNRDAAQELLFNRSCFQQTSVQQYVKARQ